MSPDRVVRRASLIAAVAVAVVASVTRAGAQTAPAAPVAHPPSYALTVWASEKGAPPGDVFAMAQDPEGYLWIGTPTGLLRFDGSKFVAWAALNEREPLPAGPVHALSASHDGSLWVGMGGGGGISRISKGHIVTYGPKQGAPPGVATLIEDRQGIVWAGGRRGLFRFDGRTRWSTVEKAEGLPPVEVSALFEDKEGALWVGTVAGVFKRTKGTFELQHTDDNVQSFAEDATGAMWTTDQNEVLRRLGDQRAPRPDPAVRLPASGWRLLGDRRGQIWVAAFGGGLMRVGAPAHASARIERFAYESRLSGSPRSLFEDRDGNIWVGMRGGLLRLTEASFDSSVPLDGLTHDGVRTTAAAPDGSIWVATGHSLNRFDKDPTRREVYSLSQTTALHVDRRGTVWAVASTQGLGRIVDGRFVPEGADLPAQMLRIMALTSDSRGVVWICSAQRGVMAWDGTMLTRFEQETQVTNRGCVAAVTDRHDRAWFGFQSGGVAVYDKGTFQLFGAKDGIPPGPVLSIIEDRSGAMWVSTASGLSRYQNGHITPITQANAPLVDLVPVLVEDEEGYIWAGINSGLSVIRFHPREADRLAANPAYHVEYALYDDTDGLQQTPLTWQSGVGAVRGVDGRLWVTSGAGIAVIDPRNLPHSRRPAAPQIDAVTADGRRLATGQNLELPARTSTLKIEFGSVSVSSATKLRYRYQLEGYDADWVYAGQRRDATYANLPSNDYRFRVSTTQDGQWTEAAVWGFSVAPPFYLTRGFVVLAALGLTMLLGAAWWLRMRAIRDRYALVFAERARVSREIHDTLLQSLAALGVELEAVATQLDPTQAGARDDLRRIRRQVGHSLRDARESILELRRDGLTHRDVVESLREVAERATRTYGVRVEIDVTGRRPANCAADVDIQLFRIGQEALTNAIRHGHATEVRMTVAYEKDRVRLSISDNGCGFAPDAPLPAREAGEHLGLLTMRERAARVRGRLEIVSSPGSGTTIETMIPVTAE